MSDPTRAQQAQILDSMAEVVTPYVVVTPSRVQALRAGSAALRAPSPVITRDQVVEALKHVTSSVDTECILERLGFNEQEVADAIR